MDVYEYQRKAMKHAKYRREGCPEYRGVALYPFLGLSEEAGEVAGKIAKAARSGAPIDRMALAKELGDVLWMVAACAHEMGYNLDAVARLNLDKLDQRDDRGTIVGEGDDR